MLLVIFGAGASFDSYPPNLLSGLSSSDLQFRPPLTCELFTQRPAFEDCLDRYPRVKGVVAQCRERLEKGADLEALLDLVVEEATVNPIAVKELMAVRYYLFDVLNTVSRRWSAVTHGVTNYANLIRSLESWRCRTPGQQVVYVPFNYDTLCEDALWSQFRWRPENMATYINRPEFLLIKPHGSISWRQKTSAGSFEGPENVIEAADAAAKSLSEIEVGFALPNSGMRSVLPAIAVPLLSKASFACPSEHLEKLRSVLPEVEKIIVVGWRGREKHFNEMLAGKLPKLRALMIADKNATECNRVWEELRKTWAVNPYVENVDGFSGLVVREKLTGFLRRQ